VKKGFFASLFDFSFTSFITPKLVPVLYVVGLVFAVVSFVIYLGIGFSLPGGYGGLILIPALIAAVLTIIFARVGSEVIMVTFRVYERVSGTAWGVAAPQAAAPAPAPHMSTPAPAGPAAAIAYALSGEDTVEKLTRLKSLLDAGTITRQDFDREKARVLAGV
jgi:hypothetical protein